MKNERGFSLVEVLMVVAILGIIAAIAFPNLRKARNQAQMGSAIQSLRTITTAQYMYVRTNNVYASLAQLAPEGTLDTHLSIGQKSGYAFSVTVVPATPTQANGFTCTGIPLDEVAQREHFFVDETAVIRFEIGVPATATSPPIPR